MLEFTTSELPHQQGPEAALLDPKVLPPLPHQKKQKFQP